MIYTKDTPKGFYKITSLMPDDLHLPHIGLSDDAVFRYEGDNEWTLVGGSFSYNTFVFIPGDTGANYLSIMYGATIEPVQELS